MKTRKPRTNGVARARMFIKAHLYWLTGFPIQAQQNGEIDRVAWQPAPRRDDLAPESMQLTRDHLHRASRTFTRLMNRFPYALPQAVDNYEQWVLRVPQLIELCKAPVHQGVAFPRDLYEIDGAYPEKVTRKALALARQAPSLAPLIHAASWTNFLAPDELPSLFEWIESHHAKLECLFANTSHPINLPLTLWSLSKSGGPQRVESLLAILGDPRAYAHVTESDASYLDLFIEALKPPLYNHEYVRRDLLRKQFIEYQLPVPTLGKEMVSFVEWAIQQRIETCYAALDLFGLLFSNGIFDEWQLWWQQTNELLRQAKPRINVTVTLPDDATMHFYRKEANSLTKQIREQQKSALTLTQTRELFRLIPELVKPENKQLYQATIDMLPLMPRRGDEWHYRLAFTRYWQNQTYHYHSRKSLFHFLPIFHQFLMGKEEAELFVHCWLHQNSEGWRQYHEQTKSTLLLALEAYYRACYVAEKKDLDEWDFDDFVELTKCSDDADEILSLFRLYLDNNLFQENIYIDPDTLNYILEIDPKQEQTVALIKILGQIEYSEHDTVETLTGINHELNEAGWPELVKNQLLENSLADLLTSGRLIHSIESVNGFVPEVPVAKHDKTGAQIWYSHVPTELHPILAQLAQLFDNAEQIAQRVFGKEIPAPAQLRKEIAGIETQLGSLQSAEPDDKSAQRREHLTKRLDNLQQRLRTPQSIPAPRIERLRVKLERALERRLLQQWQAELQHELHRQITQMLDIIETPEWLLRPQQLTLLGHIAQLKPKIRELALDLLRLRCDPPPWSFHEHPANQAYLQQLRKRGLNLEPWYNQPIPRTMIGKNNRKVILTFADDPLDIFQMGSHFKTCLSVDDFNFFSVFANAADVNKQVLYAYDAEGYQDGYREGSSPNRVVGRCLFALTDRGQILIFHPYCHDSELGFDKLVLAYAAELAAQMKTQIVPQGNVPTLVTDEWYDDGPVDLLGVMAYLKDGSPFRKALKTIEPSELIPLFKETSAAPTIDSLALVRLINLPEIQQRPELVVPLLPLFESATGIPVWQEHQAMRLAHQAGANETIYRYYCSKGVAEILRIYLNQGDIRALILMVLIEFEPSLALRILRQSRPTGVRRDEDDEEWRRRYLAQAHMALNRPHRAERLATS